MCGFFSFRRSPNIRPETYCTHHSYTKVMKPRVCRPEKMINADVSIEERKEPHVFTLSLLEQFEIILEGEISFQTVSQRLHRPFLSFRMWRKRQCLSLIHPLFVKKRGQSVDDFFRYFYDHLSCQTLLAIILCLNPSKKKNCLESEFRQRSTY